MAGESAYGPPKPLSVMSSGGTPAAERLRLGGPRFGLQVKLILPYILLTLVLAIAAVFVVTQLASQAVRQRYADQARATVENAGHALTRIAAAQLDSLRLLVFTQGLPEALAAGEVDRVVDLIQPIGLNAGVPVLAVADAQGRQLVALTLNAGGTAYERTQGADLSQVDIVRRVLARESDASGDKFVGILHIQGAYYLFTTAPLTDGQGQLLGVMMMGQSLDEVLKEVKAVSGAEALVLVDRLGNRLGAILPDGMSDPGGFWIETDDLPMLLTAEAVAPDEVDIAGRPFLRQMAPLSLRGEVVGALAVGVDVAPLRAQEAELTTRLALLFTGAMLAVLAVGYVINRSIVEPVDKLRRMALAVADGDLDQRLRLPQNDEIADLALTFSEMTERLAERTRESERLHAETMERARQLEDTNQRLRKAQQQLVQSEKLASIGQLTAGIVHDVKNPLAVIKGIAELVQLEDATLSTFAQEQIGLIRDNASHANAIVSDLLTFARQSTPQWQRHDLRDTIQAALRLTEYLLRQAGVQPEADLPADPVMTVYDSRQIEQVLINLIQNAAQAMPSGGAVRIALRVTGVHALLTVADTGVGIGPEQIGRVFDPFYTTKSEGEGTGLGLSVTYGIISQHGGEIWASSERDRGTTFSIRLPIRDQAPEQSF